MSGRSVGYLDRKKPERDSRYGVTPRLSTIILVMVAETHQYWWLFVGVVLAGLLWQGLRQLLEELHEAVTKSLEERKNAAPPADQFPGARTPQSP
jgi:hypothetical protein